jgi:hypothetical protein
MEIKMSITRCASPSEKCGLCWQCKRNMPVEDDEGIEEFTPERKMPNNWQCNGYISKRQEKGLFDE